MPHPNYHYLFVYGSSRRGEANDVAALCGDARFISRAFVRGRLYDLDHGACIALDPVASWVTGELFSVSPTDLELLDKLEQERSGFRRSHALVHDAEGGAWPCWTYLPPSVPMHRQSVIPGGDWVRYRKGRQRRVTAFSDNRYGFVTGTPYPPPPGV